MGLLKRCRVTKRVTSTTTNHGRWWTTVDTTPEVRRAVALAAWPATWVRDEEAESVVADHQADHNRIRREPILADTLSLEAQVSESIRQSERILHASGRGRAGASQA
jgi:hypothetical protein